MYNKEKKYTFKGVLVMKRILYNRLFIMAVLFIVAVAISVWFVQNVDFIKENWNKFIDYGFAIASSIGLLVSFSNKFNIFIAKLWVILINGSSIWTVMSEFKGNVTITDYNKIIKELKQRNEVTKITPITQTALNLNMDGLHYELEFVEDYIDDEAEGKIICSVQDFTTSYDNSIRLLEKSIIPNIKIIEKNLGQVEEQFTFTIKFKGKNPFVRMITRKVDSKLIHTLWFTQSEETKLGRKDVLITEKSIKCTTTDISDFQNSSIDYISLGSAKNSMETAQNNEVM